ncbi:Hypothetical predicted protein [Lynx pardinus]|uniref:L1 transposable element RRM domain-containing protein n=1 Tax=Lynx pardinus TaxID=191816 RepID=A0A485MG36_LYNPA|nr:Hypothetical predicted protein [Lynx pardinus]
MEKNCQKTSRTDTLEPSIDKRPTEEGRKGREIEYEGRIRELSDAIKRNNIHIIGIPEEEETEKGAEGVLEEIIAENIPDLGKEKGIEIQEVQRTPFMIFCMTYHSETGKIQG